MHLKRSSHLVLLAKYIITLLLVLSSDAHSHSHSHEFFQNLVGVEKGMTVKGVHQLKQYLQKYGYLNYGENHANNDEFDDAVESAVKRYQEFFSLNSTGKLDSDTVIQMAKPRCGFPDIINDNSRMQVNPQYTFTIGNPKWPPSKMDLSYIFNSSVQVFDVAELSPLMALAFGKWASVTHFKFGQVSFESPKDITIGFYRGDELGDEYGDAYKGALALAAEPPYGIFQINADWKWTTAEPDNTEYDLQSVAVHEIGHLLGLGHSSLEDAVMWPYTGIGQIRRELTVDDVQGIHALYGI